MLRPGGRARAHRRLARPRPASTPTSRGLAGRIACIADARPIADTLALLEAAGFHVDHIERHDDALAATIELVPARLRALRLLDLPLLRPFNIRRAIDVTRRVAEVVARGDAGYALFIATAMTRT